MNNPFQTLTVKSTHFFLIDLPDGRLLLDAGWELEAFAAQMKASKASFTDIRYVMFTHTHPDHAGLVQEIKQRSGARLIIHEVQIPYLKDLRAFSERKGWTQPIELSSTDLVSPNRRDLEQIGLHGELVETPGHSPDSISLALDNGAAFTGDLTSPLFADEETGAVIAASWQALLDRGATTFYPSHTPPVPAEIIRSQLKSSQM
jgi:glyoxylase-like metal-dependent hydrolase (beta-lactamase superfamily II)